MKKILPILTLVTIIAIIIIIFLSMSNKKQMTVIHTGNHTHQAVEIIPNHFQDTQCGMTITTTKHSAQAVSPDGRTWFFDDVGCLVLWYNNIKFQKEAILWVYTNDTNEYIDARTAWFSRIDTTPMGHGFGSYKNKQDNFITFDEVVLKVLRNEDLRNPYIRKELLGK
ncbi:hypothetical protein [Arcobacter sp. s6]|jgi:copper chaperone NosL|uniref:hypothetical protein n=1 Tax=Arcobacter sp. s6 TaxID=3230363 RepID=UPI0034A076C9